MWGRWKCRLLGEKGGLNFDKTTNSWLRLIVYSTALFFSFIDDKEPPEGRKGEWERGKNTQAGTRIHAGTHTWGSGEEKDLVLIFEVLFIL